MTPAARLWIWRVSAWAPPVFALLRGIQWTAAGRLGPNPVEFLEHYTGDWALRLLLATLAMTPLRRLTGLTEPIRVPADADDAALEAARLAVENALNEATRRAYAAVDRRGGEPARG